VGGVERCAFSDWCWREDLPSSPRWLRTLRRWGRIWSNLGRLRRPASSKRGAAAVGAGTRCRVIGASGEGDGFRRIARQTIITGAQVPTALGEALRRLERSLWGRARPLRRLAILRRRLLIHAQSGIETPAIWACAASLGALSIDEREPGAHLGCRLNHAPAASGRALPRPATLFFIHRWYSQ
jgi:hypothetical protein